MERAGAEKLGVECVGAAERKLGAGCEKLGAERDGCEKVGADARYEGAGCDGDGDRTCGCCCAKPELDGVR